MIGGRLARGLELLVLVLPLGAGACLIGPNPDFIESGTDTQASESDASAAEESDSSETGDDACAAGFLDCDDEPGCEADPNDPTTCGSCSRTCEIAGVTAECVDGLCTGTLLFTGADDAYVAADLPDANFGGAPVLRVSMTDSTYVELPALGELPSGADIDSVALHLTATQVGAAIDIYRIEAPWDELDLTQANAPAINGAPLLSFTPALGDNAIELVDLLNAWQLGSPKHSIALRPAMTEPPDPAPVEFSSGEGVAPPYLVITSSW